MTFIPRMPLAIVKEEQFPQKIEEMETALEQVKQPGFFRGFENLTLYYEYYPAQNPKATLVVVHGLSEFTNKFHEFIYYALTQGYNVYTYDQRCHGRSDRLTKRHDLLHVNLFSDYVKDLEQFMETVVLPNCQTPLYLYCHSMGGAVCSHYLAIHKTVFKKAVFTSPMFEPVVRNFPSALARSQAVWGRYLYGKKRKIFMMKGFNPNATFKGNSRASKARFEHHIKQRKLNKNFQSTPITFGWFHQAMLVKKQVINPQVAGAIQTPILLMQAGADRVVQAAPQLSFVKACPTCSLIHFEQAPHGILLGSTPLLEQVIPAIFSFYGEV